MTDRPEPMVSAEVDCTDLDGFMLNVERLMASELVALSSHEVIGAALLLWCRAWKQRPAASLPNDDKVIAAFARMPLPRFRKLRDEILRGFVLCSDGRLYHRTLATEAANAYERKVAFQRKRQTDAERLRQWRGKKHETPDETRTSTQDETRFVAEGQGQGQGQGQSNTGVAYAPPVAGAGASRSDLMPEDRPPADPPPAPDIVPTAAGSICRRLREAGIQRVSPSNADLLAFIAAGGTVDELLPLVPSAAGKGDPFTWLLAAAINRRKRAKAEVADMRHGRLPNRQESLEARNRAVADEWLRSEGAIP